MTAFGKPTPGVPVDPPALPPYTQADAAAALEQLGAPDAETLALLELRAIIARARAALATLEDAAAEIVIWLGRYGSGR